MKNNNNIPGNKPVIIDVRTSEEFAAGHASGALNIPLDRIESLTQFIRQLGQPVFLCCASGMRSGVATDYLRSCGIECINLGPWRDAELLINQ
jgi:rhodanese-related sulfurtransferase